MSAERILGCLIALVLISSMVLAACGPTPEPEVVTEVVKETIKETVIVEGTPELVEKEVTKIVEVEKEVEVVVTATPEPEPVKLVVAIPSEPTSLDPQGRPTARDWWVMDQVFDYLIRLDAETAELVPQLATSWEISEDGLTYTFELRDDVTYHDGTPFNAESVCANVERILDPETESAWAAADLANFESCEVLGEYEVALHLSEVMPDLLQSLASRVFMVSTTAAEELGPLFIMKPVGSGPFMVEEWIPRKHILLKKNPDYNWGPSFNAPGPSQIDVLEIRAIPEAETRVAALLTGEVDMIAYVGAQFVADLKEQGYTVDSRGMPGIPSFVGLNVQKFPTDELAVRQALEYAVDRVAFADVLYFGIPSPAYAAASSQDPNYDQSKECEFYSYDPEKAMELLEEAGWVVGDDGIREKDGQRLVVDFKIPDTSHWMEPAELLQAQYREVGIDFSVTEMARGAWYDNLRPGTLNAYIWSWSGFVSAGIWQSHFHSDYIGTYSNFVRFDNPEMDQITERLVVATDPEEAEELRKEMMCMAMEQALWVPIIETRNTTAMQPNVKGVVYANGSHALLHSVYFEE
jgi:peptide/nickel transport system substrate-binding protein